MFDVDNLVEDVLKNFVSPDIVASRNFHYFSLERADKYLYIGNISRVQLKENENNVYLAWMNSSLNNYRRFYPAGGPNDKEFSYLIIDFVPRSIRVGYNGNSIILISSLDWQVFAEQDLPKLVSRK